MKIYAYSLDSYGLNYILCLIISWACYSGVKEKKILFTRVINNIALARLCYKNKKKKNVYYQI